MTETGIFISFSASDTQFVNRILNDLQGRIQEPIIDTMGLETGQSLVTKLLRDGLSHCKYFIVVLSKESVRSKWVKFELDTMLVDNLKELTSIVPIIKEKCQVPVELKQFQVVDFSKDYEHGISLLISTLSGRNDRSTIQTRYDPRTVTTGVNRLSVPATMVGYELMYGRNDQLSFERVFGIDELRRGLPNLSETDLNRAIEELEQFGLVKTLKSIGSSHSTVEPTYSLYSHFKGYGLDYDPTNDALLVASKLLNTSEITAENLENACGLPPGRIRRAVDYLSEYGVITVTRCLGGDYIVTPKSQTQTFVRSGGTNSPLHSKIRQVIYDHIQAELQQLSQIDRPSVVEFQSIIDNLDFESMNEHDAALKAEQIRESIIFRMADLGY